MKCERWALGFSTPKKIKLIYVDQFCLPHDIEHRISVLERQFWIISEVLFTGRNNLKLLKNYASETWAFFSKLTWKKKQIKATRPNYKMFKIPEYRMVDYSDVGMGCDQWSTCIFLSVAVVFQPPRTDTLQMLVVTVQTQPKLVFSPGWDPNVIVMLMTSPVDVYHTNLADEHQLYGLLIGFH